MGPMPCGASSPPPGIIVGQRLLPTVAATFLISADFGLRAVIGLTFIARSSRESDL